ncbi:MAG: ATP-binding protein [Rhodospirillaceae bacterium]|nr:ATP-binding protein [Rhodospirillaceae bacterium]
MEKPQTHSIPKSATARDLAIKLVPLSIIILLLVGVIMETVTRQQLESDARSHIDSAAKRLAATLETRFAILEESLVGIANNEIIVNSLIDTSSRVNLALFFNSLRAPVKGDSYISLTDYKGRLLATTSPYKSSFVNSWWLKNVLGGERVKIFTTTRMVIAIPVFYNGLPEGMLVAEFPMDTYQNLLLVGNYTDKYAILLDETVIQSNDNDFLFPGTMVSEKILKNESDFLSGWLLARSAIENSSDISVVTGNSKEVAFAPLENIRNALIISGFLLAAVLILAIFLMLRTFSKPLAQLSAEVRNIKGGEDLKRKITIAGPDEFQSLANAFNDMNSALALSLVEKDAAEAANKAKSEFLSSMSHELRTPLNAILGFAQILATDPDAPLNDDQKESLHQIERGGEHLLGLINDILDLSKIEAGQLHVSMEAVDPAPVLNHAVAITRELGKGKNISVILDESCNGKFVVNVDRTRFQQVLLNILSNAIKYNKDNGTVTISLNPNVDGFVRFLISDTGKGIAPELQDDIFVPFNRLGAEGGEIEGTGIGMTITQRLVEMMGGRMGFESTLGVGSTFWIEFRPDEIQNLSKRDIIKATNDGHNSVETLKVLYVEDNPSNLMLMDKIIGRIENTKLISAHTAEIGISLAESERPNIILMDINLPGMSGVEALEVIKKSETLSNIPVIAVSANAIPSDIKNALRAGFSQYLTKPFNLQAVVDIVKKYS